MLSNHMRPPNSPTIRRDSVSPSPVPSSLAGPRPPCWKVSKIRFLVLRRHSDTGVCHRYHEVGVIPVGADGHAAAIRCELDRVGQQVEDDLFEQYVI